MKKLTSIFFIVVTAFAFNSCGFDLSSNDNTIELPNTYGINVEALFNTPDFILQHQVKFDLIEIKYKVRKNDAFAATVKIYVSQDQSADAVEMPGDQDVINVTLGVNESEKSGVVSSTLLVSILNSKQPQFIIGAQNLSVSPISSVFIDLDVRYTGSYSL
jgi:hypothetical protein